MSQISPFLSFFFPTVVVSSTNATNDRLEDTKHYNNASERQAAHYNRDHPRYPYKSHGQWLKGFYGMAACIILVTFNGVAAFLERPFDVRRFVASYISVYFPPCFPQSVPCPASQEAKSI